MAYTVDYKKYEVTFTENKKKYNATTRTILVHALNEYHATMLVQQEFGSFTSRIPQLKPSSKIKIDSCVEIKDEVMTKETQSEEVLINQ